MDDTEIKARAEEEQKRIKLVIKAIDILLKLGDYDIE